MEHRTKHHKIELFLALPDSNPDGILSSGEELLVHYPKETFPSNNALVHYRIGIARIAKGEYEAAFRSLSEARHLHDELGEEQSSLKDLLAFGRIYGLSEQPEAAFETFLSVRDRSRELAYHEIEEAADRNMGRICFEQERYEEGIGFINAALKLNETTGHQKNRAAALHELGRIELHQGRIESAAVRLEEAEKAFRNDSKTFENELLITLGDLSIRNGNYEKAESYLSEALETCSSRGMPYGEILALFHLGNLRKATGDDKAAAEYWTLCFEKTDSTMLRHLKVKSGEKLVEYFSQNGDWQSALKVLESVRRIEQRVRDETLHHTISVYDQSMRIDDLEKEMRSWRRRSGELERIRNEKEDSIRDLETIKNIGEKITASLDPDAIVEALHNMLSQLMTVDGLVIGFYSEAEQELDLRYMFEDGVRIEPMIIELKPEESLSSWVVHNDQDLIINSREEGTAYTKAIRHIAGSSHINESFLFVRLRIEGRIIGVMAVQAREKNRYRDRHLNVLKALAGFIAVAMANSNAHQSLVNANEKIAHMATHDPLTGLPNRMQIMNRLNQEIERCKRYSQTLAVLFIDLDGFKTINDTRGHKAGDALLIGLAERLASGIRGTDAVGRLAGDEFLVILTDDCTPENGMALADQIRSNMSLPIKFEGNRLKVTASVGMAFYPADAINPGELVNAADQAMYDAKSAGKDLTRMHRKN